MVLHQKAARKRGFLVLLLVMDVFNSFITKVETNIIDPAIRLMALIAFVWFAYGVFEMIRSGASDEARKTGRRHMIYGIIGMVIMFGAGVIVKILTNFVTALS